ncbi:hypothetical protein [Rufibacter tibetensis]|uniref:Guanylate cyclase domain-containing protein n=1 Tax=Rufibacter tibetensis TaxID=512763 RepID=A0A0P0CHA7_9BACT|nr:hypothetical protein [Rufibacter tibetensis]ALI98585.1 hypothetical protein DC20_05875 [Rufibacter tibetensis]
MYENRITAFIDILGFRNIVNKTTADSNYAKQVFEVLSTMNSEFITSEMFAELNLNAIPKSEIEEVKQTRSMMSKALLGESSIKVTHFSDSIVLSIGLENDMYAMSLIEYLGRLIYRLWKDFKILIRGSITVGRLVHVEGGPLFGPAMVNAYDLETNLASHPRIILDDYCSLIVKNSQSYNLMKLLFLPFSESKTTNNKEYTIKNGLEINLATIFKHMLNSPLGLHPIKRTEIFEEIKDSTVFLSKILKGEELDRVKAKYQYLIDRIRETQYPPNQ